MRRLALLVIAAALVAFPAAAQVVEDAQDVGASVSPGTGHLRTTFSVFFTAQQDTGIHGVSQSDYSVNVSRKAGERPGCGSSVSGSAGDVMAHQKVKVRLRAPAGGWCTGRYTGEVWFSTGPYCADYTKPCPMFPSQARPVGHFSFRIKRH